MKHEPQTDNTYVNYLVSLIKESIDERDQDLLLDVIEAYSWEPIIYVESKEELLKRILWVESIQQGRNLEGLVNTFETDVDLSHIINELTMKVPSI